MCPRSRSGRLELEGVDDEGAGAAGSAVAAHDRAADPDGAHEVDRQRRAAAAAFDVEVETVGGQRDVEAGLVTPQVTSRSSRRPMSRLPVARREPDVEAGAQLDSDRGAMRSRRREQQRSMKTSPASMKPSRRSWPHTGVATSAAAIRASRRPTSRWPSSRVAAAIQRDEQGERHETRHRHQLGDDESSDSTGPVLHRAGRRNKPRGSRPPGPRLIERAGSRGVRVALTCAQYHTYIGCDAIDSHQAPRFDVSVAGAGERLLWRRVGRDDRDDGRDRRDRLTTARRLTSRAARGNNFLRHHSSASRLVDVAKHVRGR